MTSADVSDFSPCAQIKLWFSGHYHLSHDYDRSMNVVNNCLFVQVGVMAQCDRDGRRQSRIVRGGEKGFKICECDCSSCLLTSSVVGFTLLSVTLASLSPGCNPLHTILVRAMEHSRQSDGSRLCSRRFPRVERGEFLAQTAVIVDSNRLRFVAAGKATDGHVLFQLGLSVYLNPRQAVSNQAAHRLQGSLKVPAFEGPF